VEDVLKKFATTRKSIGLGLLFIIGVLGCFGFVHHGPGTGPTPVCDSDGVGGSCGLMCAWNGGCGTGEYIEYCEECALEMGYEEGSPQYNACSKGGNCEFCLCPAEPQK